MPPRTACIRKIAEKTIEKAADLMEGEGGKQVAEGFGGRDTGTRG